MERGKAILGACGTSEKNSVVNLFYEPELERNKTEILLNEQESRHALKVLRYKPGDAMLLTNGRGRFFDATLLSATKKHCWLQVTAARSTGEEGAQRHLITAPLKNRNRLEWLLEKATELGASAISLVHTHHTERTKVNDDRVERLLASAMKQSMRATLPAYQQYSSLQQCLEDLPEHGQRLIAECETPDKPHLSQAYYAREPVHFLFGPEGDFSQEELTMAFEAGFQPVTLGDLRMRAETAPLAAFAMLEVLEASSPVSGSNFAR